MQEIDLTCQPALHYIYSQGVYNGLYPNRNRLDYLGQLRGALDLPKSALHCFGGTSSTCNPANPGVEHTDTLCPLFHICSSMLAKETNCFKR